MDKEYLEIKILISLKTRNKLKDGLKIYNVLKSLWDSASLDTKLFISVKKEFDDALVKIMLDKKCKIKVKDRF